MPLTEYNLCETSCLWLEVASGEVGKEDEPGMLIMYLAYKSKHNLEVN